MNIEKKRFLIFGVISFCVYGFILMVNKGYNGLMSGHEIIMLITDYTDQIG